jgi:hypothetical protein
MCLITAAVALAAGAASGFFGIGGGFLIVPGLILATGMPMISAVGSSLLSLGSFGLTTAINYATSGLIDWTLAAEFIGGGIVGGVIGMLLSTYLSGSKGFLNHLFAGLIFVVAGYVLPECLSVNYGLKECLCFEWNCCHGLGTTHSGAG